MNTTQKAVVFDRLVGESSNYWEQAYKWRPTDRLCTLCGEEEGHHHAIVKCANMQAERLELPGRILNIVNAYCDTGPRDLPIFYHTTATKPWTREDVLWQQVSAFDKTPWFHGLYTKSLLQLPKRGC